MRCHIESNSRRFNRHWQSVAEHPKITFYYEFYEEEDSYNHWGENLRRYWVHNGIRLNRVEGDTGRDFYLRKVSLRVETKDGTPIDTPIYINSIGAGITYNQQGMGFGGWSLEEQKNMCFYILNNTEFGEHLIPTYNEQIPPTAIGQMWGEVGTASTGINGVHYISGIKKEIENYYCGIWGSGISQYYSYIYGIKPEDINGNFDIIFERPKRVSLPRTPQQKTDIVIFSPQENHANPLQYEYVENLYIILEYN